MDTTSLINMLTTEDQRNQAITSVLNGLENSESKETVVDNVLQEFGMDRSSVPSAGEEFLQDMEDKLGKFYEMPEEERGARISEAREAIGQKDWQEIVSDLSAPSEQQQQSFGENYTEAIEKVQEAIGAGAVGAGIALDDQDNLGTEPKKGVLEKIKEGFQNLHKSSEEKIQGKLFPENKIPDVASMDDQGKRDRVNEIYDKAMSDPDYGKNPLKDKQLIDVANKEIRKEGLGETAKDMYKERAKEDLNRRFGDQTMNQSLEQTGLSEQEARDKVSEIQETYPDQDQADIAIRDAKLGGVAKEMEAENIKKDLDETYGKSEDGLDKAMQNTKENRLTKEKIEKVTKMQNADMAKPIDLSDATKKVSKDTSERSQKAPGKSANEKVSSLSGEFAKAEKVIAGKAKDFVKENTIDQQQKAMSEMTL